MKVEDLEISQTVVDEGDSEIHPDAECLICGDPLTVGEVKAFGICTDCYANSVDDGMDNVVENLS